MIVRRHIIRISALMLLGLTPRLAQAQRSAEVESIQTFRFQLSDLYLDVNAEGEREVQEAGVPTVYIHRHRVILQPAVGVGFNGSIYHPNLLSYNLLTELGLDWQDAGEAPDPDVIDSHFLQRYHGTLDIFRQQPYATTFFADKDVAYRDYDFFTRVRVNSERWGGRTGYSTGPVPFSVSAQHYEEVTEDLSRPTSLTEDTITVSAQNLREAANGQTQLSYNLNDYTRQDNGFDTQSGLNNNLSIFDSEGFGGDLARLTSLLNYNSITETPAPNDKLLVQENLQLQHSQQLRSVYEYGFDYSSAGDSDANSHNGRAGVIHQLYDNLTSGADVHAYLANSSSPGNWQKTKRFGPSLSEQYTRPLGNWGNINVGYSGGINREDRDANGQTLMVIDEVHVLTDGIITFLNEPNVDVSTLQVTDPTHTIVYIPGLDYRTFQRGLLTEIQRVPGGQIPNGGTVLASYSALLQGSAKFWSYENAVNFRLDLWKGLLALYFRWTLVEFDGAEQLHLRTLDDKIMGVESTWKWFRVGAEYEKADSNIAPYDRARLFQSVTFRPDDRTLLSFDADQNWSVFHENNLRDKGFGFMLRAQVALAANLTWNTEAGLRIDRGDTFNRDLSVVRTGLNWFLGKLTVNFGYEYNHESHPEDLRERHYAFLRARRAF